MAREFRRVTTKVGGWSDHFTPRSTPAQHAPHPMPATFNDVLAVLAPPGGAHGVGEGIFGFLGMGAARPLRLVSKVLVSSWALPRAP